LSVNGSDTGTWALGTTGRINLGGGTRTINDGFALTSTGGSLVINGGTLDQTASITLPATMTIALQNAGAITNAQNLTIAGTFNWVDGLVSATGAGFTTSGVTNLFSGELDADWLITSGGIVHWRGGNLNQFVVNGSTITNQGVFNIVSFDSGGATRPLLSKLLASTLGGAFINAGTLVIDSNAGPNGEPADSVLFNLDFDNRGGDIIIKSGTLGLSGPLTLDAGESLQGNGTFIGDVINTAGIVAPGTPVVLGTPVSAGALNIQGNFTQGPAGTVSIRLDTASGPELDFGVLNVSGNLNAGGRITFDLINGSTQTTVNNRLSSVTNFEPVVFASFAGQFSDVAIPAGLNFDYSADGGGLSITNGTVSNVVNQLQTLFESENLTFEDLVIEIKFIEDDTAVADDTDIGGGDDFDSGPELELVAGDSDSGDAAASEGDEETDSAEDTEQEDKPKLASRSNKSDKDESPKKEKETKKKISNLVCK
jgi:hypothetical protein